MSFAQDAHFFSEGVQVWAFNGLQLGKPVVLVANQPKLVLESSSFSFDVWGLLEFVFVVVGLAELVDEVVEVLTFKRRLFFVFTFGQRNLYEQAGADYWLNLMLKPLLVDSTDEALSLMRFEFSCWVLAAEDVCLDDFV